MGLLNSISAAVGEATQAEYFLNIGSKNAIAMHLFVALVAVGVALAVLAYLKRLLHLSRWDHFPGPKAASRCN